MDGAIQVQSVTPFQNTLLAVSAMMAALLEMVFLEINFIGEMIFS